MAAINRVVLTGRLTKDPELRTTPTGKQVVNFSIAVQKRVKPQGDEPDAHFIRCVAWGTSAEFLSNYATKGRLVAIDGRLDQRRYKGSDGVDRDVVEVVAESVSLLDKPRDQQDTSTDTDNHADEPFPEEISSGDYDPFEEE